MNSLLESFSIEHLLLLGFVATPIFVLGLIAGSFINAVIYRVPNKESLNTRSHCVHCHAMIKWYQNIPVFSYLALRGKCANCKGKISARYPLIELLMGFLFVGMTLLINNLFFWVQLDTDNYVDMSATLALIAGYCVLTAALTALFVIDVERKLLPRQIIYWGAGLLLVAQIAAVALSGGSLIPLMIEAAICAVALFAFYFALWFLYPKGMGFGDVRLAALIGLAGGFFGWQVVVVGTFAAFLLAGVYGIALMIFAKDAGRKTAIPFGPWMMIGLLVGLIFGHSIIDIYMSVSGLS